MKGILTPMQDLTLTLIQSKLTWENPCANQEHFEDLIEKISSKTDLIVLPEMFSTGFSMQAHKFAQSMTGETVKWLQKLSLQKGVDITGSVMICEDGRYYNRLLWATSKGAMFTYDKKHLFRYAGEEKIYTPGINYLTVTLNGWRIRPFICYDLRFPIWTRNLHNGYDLALFVANWPAKRAAHWRLLLQSRAVENLSYVAGINRIGYDGNLILYNGDSIVVNPEGIVLFDAEDQEAIASVVLSAENLKEYRHNFPALKDADTNMVRSHH
jgi:omega-amidase